MSIVTNLHGRLRNTALPISHGLITLFEAVINSIHAIEEADLSMESGEIKVEILRNPQRNFEFKKPIIKEGWTQKRILLVLK